MSRALRSILCCLGALAGVPAAAHDFWIEPSSFLPAPGSAVAIRLKVGEHFRGDPVPRDPDRIVRFVLLGAAGESPVSGVPGGEPAGYVRMATSGLYVVGYQSNRASIELAAEKFEQYLALEGLEAVSAVRAERQQTGSPGREVYSRCAKALLRVAGEAAADAGARPLGCPFELLPGGDPTRLAPGSDLSLRLVYAGRPLARALVVALRQEAPEEALSARSDRDGRVSFHLPAAGHWLVKSVHMVPAPAETGADWESFWASLTFELSAR